MVPLKKVPSALYLMVAMPAIGAVGVLKSGRFGRSRCRCELAWKNDAAALLLLGEVLGDLRMVGADVAGQAVEKTGRLQPAA